MIFKASSHRRRCSAGRMSRRISVPLVRIDIGVPESARARMMPGIAGFENVLAPDLYRHMREQYPLSKYMKKFMAEGKRIYFVHYRKQG